MWECESMMSFDELDWGCFSCGGKEDQLDE